MVGSVTPWKCTKVEDSDDPVANGMCTDVADTAPEADNMCTEVADTVPDTAWSCGKVASIAASMCTKVGDIAPVVARTCTKVEDTIPVADNTCKKIVGTVSGSAWSWSCGKDASVASSACQNMRTLFLLVPQKSVHSNPCGLVRILIAA